MKAEQQLWEQVCQHFPPCFHHFFLEEWRSPAAWFEHRLAYTRSTAVNSMAGFIIGLGDRHLNNILINRRYGSTAVLCMTSGLSLCHSPRQQSAMQDCHQGCQM